MTYEDFLARRSPAVRERIERLNPKRDPAERIRGWHPHKRSNDFATRNRSKSEFIRRFGRAAFAALPRASIIHDGHRKSVRYEDERDMTWTLPADHPYRRASATNFPA